MRVSDVRKRYPDFFATVESAVWYDIREINLKNGSGKRYNPLHIFDKYAKRISYNAAAVATLELHKIISKKKNICYKKIAAEMEREVVKVKNGSSPMNLSTVSKWAQRLRGL